MFIPQCCFSRCCCLFCGGFFGLFVVWVLFLLWVLGFFCVCVCVVVVVVVVFVVVVVVLFCFLFVFCFLLGGYCLVVVV